MSKKEKASTSAQQDEATTTSIEPDAKSQAALPMASEHPPESDTSAKPTEDNTESSATPADKTNKSAKPRKLTKPATSADKDRSGMQIPWLSILLLLLIGAVIYAVYGNYQLVQDAQRTDQMQSAKQQSLSADLAKLQQDLNQTEAHNQQLLAQLSDSAQERQALQQSIKNLSDELAKQGRGPRQWRIAEVDYLLNVANQRLMLSRDVKTALSALNDADDRLERIADPALIPVRRSIASEIVALKAVQLPDIPGMAVTLSGLSDNIEHLPLINKEHVFNREQDKQAPAKNWRDIPDVLWKGVKSLVTIRRNQAPVERLLPPEEIHYLYQNLGLKLEQARLALLRQDTALFHNNLSDTQTWIKRYFDAKSSAVSSVLDSLANLDAVNLQPALPDISASLRILRQKEATQPTHATLTPSKPRKHVSTRPVPAASAKPTPTNPPATP